jgi:hypothetical protein
MLVDPARLEREYYTRKPDIGDPDQRVFFGTSGHRGSPLAGAFTEGPHRRDHPGHLQLPPWPWDRRPLLLD